MGTIEISGQLGECWGRQQRTLDKTQEFVEKEAQMRRRDYKPSGKLSLTTLYPPHSSA